MRAEGRAGVSYPGEVLPALLENFSAIGHHTLNNYLISHLGTSWSRSTQHQLGRKSGPFTPWSHPVGSWFLLHSQPCKTLTFLNFTLDLIKNTKVTHWLFQLVQRSVQLLWNPIKVHCRYVKNVNCSTESLNHFMWLLLCRTRALEPSDITSNWNQKETESGGGRTPWTSMRSTLQELICRRPSSSGLCCPSPKLSPGPFWLAGNRSRAWAPLNCPLWQPMATGNYGRLETWLAWTERCCECRTYAWFWRLSGKKACKIFREDFLCWLHDEVIAFGPTGLDEMHH